MLESQINKFLSLPELKFTKKRNLKNYVIEFECYKTNEFEVCPKCATKSYKVHDRVFVNIKDIPIRNKLIFLKIKKRRFKCPNCKSVFREPIPGIKKGFKTTQRFRSHIRWCASNFSDLKRVTKQLQCSSWLVYTAFYEQLKLENKKWQNEWSSTIGVDEHSFLRNSKNHSTEFTSMFVDYNNNRVREAVLGRSMDDLENSRSIDDLENSRIMDIKGRENVKNVVMDMSGSYKKFVTKHFPNAIITCDKFHVVKLFNHALNRIRIEVMKHPYFLKSRNSPVRRLYLKNYERLSFSERHVVRHINSLFPELKEMYRFKERMLSIYNIKGFKRARKAMTKLTDEMAQSGRKIVKSLRKTVVKWRREILNYFRTMLTNGRTEGYNRKAKLIQRKAYGYRNFENYRLRLIYDCR